MHEISIITSVLSIVKEEMAKHDVHKLFKVNLCYGALTNVVADSLYFAFEVLIKNTNLEGACLELEEIPVTLICLNCSEKVIPEDKKKCYFLPCPLCGFQKGYEVEAGRELYIKHIEAK